MAFKEEKPQSMLSKWWQMNRALYVRDSEEPPPLIEDCYSLKDAYRWRETIMKEIGDKVAEIQNAGMGDYKIRALNDEINLLINHKRQWEQRIRQLGGPNFLIKEKSFLDSQGVELPGSGGYMYFGAAKDLPGVRELFFQQQKQKPTESIEILQQRLVKEYYEDFNIDEQFQKELQEYEQNYDNEQLENWIFQNSDNILQEYPNLLEKDPEEVKEILANKDYIEWYDRQFKNEKSEQEILEEKKKKLIELINNQILIFEIKTKKQNLQQMIIFQFQQIKLIIIKRMIQLKYCICLLVLTTLLKAKDSIKLTFIKQSNSIKLSQHHVDTDNNLDKVKECIITSGGKQQFEGFRVNNFPVIINLKLKQDAMVLVPIEIQQNFTISYIDSMGDQQQLHQEQPQQQAQGQNQNKNFQYEEISFICDHSQQNQITIDIIPQPYDIKAIEDEKKRLCV